MKRIAALTILLTGAVTLLKAQDCNPCIAIDKLQIFSPANLGDTVAQLNAGIKVGLNIQLDNEEILGIAEPYSRILDFSDDKKANLLRKGEQIHNFFENYVLQKKAFGEHVSMTATGIDYNSLMIDPGHHSMSLDISTLAKPTDGAQTLYLEGQIGVYVNGNATEEVLAKNITLKKDEPTTIQVNDRNITFIFLRSQTVGPLTTHIFQYESDLPVLGVSESASRTPAEQLAVSQVEVSSFDNIQLMVEVPKTEIKEIPFTLKFGLGL